MKSRPIHLVLVVTACLCSAAGAVEPFRDPAVPIERRLDDEVAQRYLVPPEAGAPRPRRMLRGFSRVSLEPGESKRMTFVVSDEKLAFWNPESERFETQRGEWVVEVGASSADIRLRSRFTR